MAEIAHDVAPPGTAAPARTATAATAADGPSGAGVIAGAVCLSKGERAQRLDLLFRQRAAIEGEIVVHLGEVDRAQEFRDEGATSTEAWAAERFGVSVPTARALTRVGEKASDLPHLMGSFCAGEVSLDKVRALAEVATPETDQELSSQAKEHSVRELADIARTTAERSRPKGSSGTEHDKRSLRFNDTFRTMTAQLPADSYAEAKACLEARARQVPTDGETPWDERLAHGFSDLIRSDVPDSSGGAGTPIPASPHMVVVHVPLDALVDGSGDGTELAAELEHDGLIDTATVQKIACDAIVAVAVDDDVGHTMFEGRARRNPTGAQRREVWRRDRNCRFPGCSHVTFTDVHHVVPWKPGGPTDLENLALLCRYHHGRVHAVGWSMTGNANGELTIVAPTGRVMVSRPSPLWTRVTAGRRPDSSG
jgi:hypothetical protein